MWPQHMTETTPGQNLGEDTIPRVPWFVAKGLEVVSGYFKPYMSITLPWYIYLVAVGNTTIFIFLAPPSLHIFVSKDTPIPSG